MGHIIGVSKSSIVTVEGKEVYTFSIVSFKDTSTSDYGSVTYYTTYISEGNVLDADIELRYKGSNYLAMYYDGKLIADNLKYTGPTVRGLPKPLYPQRVASTQEDSNAPQVIELKMTETPKVEETTKVEETPKVKETPKVETPKVEKPNSKDVYDFVWNGVSMRTRYPLRLEDGRCYAGETLSKYLFGFYNIDFRGDFLALQFDNGSELISRIDSTTYIYYDMVFNLTHPLFKGKNGIVYFDLGSLSNAMGAQLRIEGDTVYLQN